jgi:hypothetical protein
MRLMPMDPRTAELDVRPLPVRAPSPPAESFSGLEQQDAAPRAGNLAGRGHSGKPAPNDDHIEQIGFV